MRVRLLGLLALILLILACPPPPPANLHYKCYRIPPAPPDRPGPIRLITQFRPEQVQVGNALALCAPVLKNQRGIVDAPDLKCYGITGDPPRARVRLDSDQFPREELDVGPALAICAPANKAEFPRPPPSTLPREPHYKCYNLPEGQPPGENVRVHLRTTQFRDEEDVRVGPARALCVPALKNPRGEPQDWERELKRLESLFPHLKCYEIQGDAPGKRVNLTSQFGDERDVPVGEPYGLCVPVKKTVLSGPYPEG